MQIQTARRQRLANSPYIDQVTHQVSIKSFQKRLSNGNYSFQQTEQDNYVDYQLENKQLLMRIAQLKILLEACQINTMIQTNKLKQQIGIKNNQIKQLKQQIIQKDLLINQQIKNHTNNKNIDKEQQAHNPLYSRIDYQQDSQIMVQSKTVPYNQQVKIGIQNNRIDRQNSIINRQNNRIEGQNSYKIIYQPQQFASNLSNSTIKRPNHSPQIRFNIGSPKKMVISSMALKLNSEINLNNGNKIIIRPISNHQIINKKMNNQQINNQNINQRKILFNGIQIINKNSQQINNNSRYDQYQPANQNIQVIKNLLQPNTQYQSQSNIKRSISPKKGVSIVTKK